MPPYRPSEGVEVSVEFLSGHVIIMALTGEWLGSWPAVSVSVSKLDEALMTLTLGKVPIHFESQEPDDFIEALQVEAQFFQSLSNWQKVARQARMSLERFETFVEISNQPPIPPEADSPLHPPIPANNPSGPNTFDDDRAVAYPEKEYALHAEISSAQEEVVGWIGLAMQSWFDYYFLLADGAFRDRLERAAAGLDQSAKDLRVVGESLEGPISDDVARNVLINTYGTAIVGWADAFELIASGARRDQRPLAREGFARMEKATEMAERVVALRASLGQQKTISGHLKTLRDLQPPQRVARRTIERAKTPWRKALKAAGSPLDWKRLST
ncbi:MAG TPA: hypothetical protein VF115_08185 [Acidimicrobiia bacterium]